MEAVWTFIKIICKACAKIFMIGIMMAGAFSYCKELNDYLNNDEV